MIQDAKPAKSATQSKAKALVKPEPSGNSGNGAEDFLKDPRWKEHFLPSLFHALYISREPFLDWTPDSPKFLVSAQKAFDIAFPNVDYALSTKDPIITTVRQTFLNITLVGSNVT